jgi:hypothetical protein
MPKFPPRTDRDEDGMPEPFYTEGEPCENCGKACDAGSRIWIPGWNYFGCDDCASEAAIVVFAEETCPALYEFVMRSRSVSEIQRAYREHERSCPNCLKVVRKVAKWENDYRKERAA